MQDLKVTDVENGALIAVADDGTRFRVSVDDTRLSELRRHRAPESRGDTRIAPREVQAHIRAGMSAQDVATLTGAPIEYVERFEGPVIAEREHIVRSALNVTVHVASDPDAGSSFGGVIRSRLADGAAHDERWASWKDPESGWIVKLTFVAETVDHDARWSFDPRTRALSPLNAEAIALSQLGEMPQSLIPRLRAVPTDDRDEGTRFDSGAFRIDEGDLAGPLSPATFAGGPGRIPDAVTAMPMNQTADLLEALRRRRGERETMAFEPDEPRGPNPAHPSTGNIRLVEVPLDSMGDSLGDGGADSDLLADSGEIPVAVTGTRGHSGTVKSTRSSRTTMPSWDEIVFGARTDDD